MSDTSSTPAPAEPATPEPAAPEPAQPEPAEPEPAQPDDSLEGKEAKARREARNLRQQLKEERSGRDDAIKTAVGESTAELTDRIGELEGQLIEREAQLAAVGKFRNPRDVTHFIDVHNTKPEQLDEVIAKVLKERPYLGVADGHALPQGQQSNGRTPSTTNGDANNWLREQIQAKGVG